MVSRQCSNYLGPCLAVSSIFHSYNMSMWNDKFLTFHTCFPLCWALSHLKFAVSYIFLSSCYFDCVCVLVSTVGLWIASNCLIVLFSVSAIFRADVIVKSLLSFTKDFYVTLRCMLNIKSLTKMVSYSHCQRLFKKTYANSLASWQHCKSLCLKIWKFALDFLCSCLHLFPHHPERQKSFIYLFALVSCPN